VRRTSGVETVPGMNTGLRQTVKPVRSYEEAGSRFVKPQDALAKSLRDSESI
jgi:hypothetical protein